MTITESKTEFNAEESFAKAEEAVMTAFTEHPKQGESFSLTLPKHLCYALRNLELCPTDEEIIEVLLRILAQELGGFAKALIFSCVFLQNDEYYKKQKKEESQEETSEEAPECP